MPRTVATGRSVAGQRVRPNDAPGNLVMNPGVEVDNSNVGQYGGNGVISIAARITTDSFSGAACASVIATTAAASDLPTVYHYLDNAALRRPAPGEYIFGRIAGKLIGAIPAGAGMRLGFRFSNNGAWLAEPVAAGTNGTKDNPVSGQWYEMWGSTRVVDGLGWRADDLRIGCYVFNVTTGVSYELRTDQAFACVTTDPASVYPYNDGASSGWVWGGTAGKSSSYVSGSVFARPTTNSRIQTT